MTTSAQSSFIPKPAKTTTKAALRTMRQSAQIRNLIARDCYRRRAHTGSLSLLCNEDGFCDPHLNLTAAPSQNLRVFQLGTTATFLQDGKDLSFLLPQGGLLEVIHGRIDGVGVVQFQNKIGYSLGGFPELLWAYLQSLMVNFEGSSYIHKDGICIGAIIAPVLSDLYLAKCDNEI